MRYFFLALAFGFGLAWPQVSLAQDDGTPGTSIVGDCANTKTGCTLDDLVPVVNNVVNIVLFLAGSGMLLMFVYGGYLWVSSGGSPERVSKGKEVIKAAIIGIVLVLGSWLIVDGIIKTFTGGDRLSDEPAEIFDDQPFNEPSSDSGSGTQ